MRAPPPSPWVALRAVALRAVAAVLLTLVVLLALGCSVDLAGQNDVELLFEGDAPPASGPPLRSVVQSRLALAQIPADVSEAGPRAVKVLVHRPLAPIAADLVEWRGDVRVVELGEPYADAPPRARPAELAALARQRPPGDDGRTLVLDGDRLRWASAPRQTIPPGTPVEREGGRALRLHAASTGELGPKAAAVLGRSAVPVSAEGGALVLSFGDGVPAYQRAYRSRLLLAGPALPRLALAKQTPVADDHALAILTVVLPALLSLAWLWFVRRFDRAHPEPRWLIGVVFLLGAAPVLPAGILEYLYGLVSPYLNPTLSTLGGQPRALPLSIAVFTLVVGVTEEAAKLCAALFAARRREFDEPVDGIVYAVTASLGFAALENVSYFASGRLSPALVCARAFMTVPAHVFFAAIWGYGLGARILHKRRIFLPFFLMSALAHGAFDALLSTEGTGLLAVVLVVGLGALFMVLVRKALRFGVVTARAPVDRAGRQLFPTGRSGAFAAAWVGLALSAFALFVLGAVYQQNRERAHLAILALSSVFVLAIGAAAWLVTATVPLDVVVDEEGVTFAGAHRAWADITGWDRAGPRAIELRSNHGDVTLGPASPPMIEALLGALARRGARADAAE